MVRKRAAYTTNGQPSSLREMQEASKEAKEHSKTEETLVILRGGATARQAHGIVISQATLQRCKNGGKLRAAEVKSIWYYSRRDLQQLVKARFNRP